MEAGLLVRGADNCDEEQIHQGSDIALPLEALGPIFFENPSRRTVSAQEKVAVGLLALQAPNSFGMRATALLFCRENE